MDNLKNKKISRGEIYMCDLKGGIGSVQSNLRPVIIIQNNKGNTFSTTTMVVPLTSKIKKKLLPTHVILNVDDKKSSIAMCEQIQTICKSQLYEYKGKVDKDVIDQIDEAIKISLGLAG